MADLLKIDRNMAVIIGKIIILKNDYMYIKFLNPAPILNLASSNFTFYLCSRYQSILSIIINKNSLLMPRSPKGIRQYNGVSGKFIREFPSISSAAKATGTAASSLKYACEIQIRCGGYYWRYTSEKKLLKVNTRRHRRGGKKVRVYKTLTGGKSKKFQVCDTISEAAKLTGISHTTIRNICRDEVSYFKGYTFEFINEEDKWNHLPEFNLYNFKRKSSRPYYRRPVKLSRNNKTHKFASIAEASRKLNVNYKSIINVLAGRWNTAGGYTVESI